MAFWICTQLFTGATSEFKLHSHTNIKIWTVYNSGPHTKHRDIKYLDKVQGVNTFRPVAEIFWCNFSNNTHVCHKTKQTYSSLGNKKKLKHDTSKSDDLKKVFLKMAKLQLV